MPSLFQDNSDLFKCFDTIKRRTRRQGYWAYFRGRLENVKFLFKVSHSRLLFSIILPAVPTIWNVFRVSHSRYCLTFKGCSMLKAEGSEHTWQWTATSYRSVFHLINILFYYYYNYYISLLRLWAPMLYSPQVLDQSINECFINKGVLFGRHCIKYLRYDSFFQFVTNSGIEISRRISVCWYSY